MKLSSILLLLATVIGISCGQILFKHGALGLAKDAKLWAIFFSMPVIAGILIYGASTVMWIYLLREVALSKAYPVFALSFVFVPILSWLFFDETLDKTYFAGMLFIIIGIIFSTR